MSNLKLKVSRVRKRAEWTKGGVCYLIDIITLASLPLYLSSI